MGIILPIGILLSLCFSACDDGFDTERPTAQLISPETGERIATDDGVPLQASFQDNGQLLQYKMLLEGIDSLNGIAKDTTLRLVFVEGLSGGSFLLDETIPLPDSTFNGYYRIIVSCIDDDGNEAYPDTATIRIVNSIDSVAPKFNVFGFPEDTLRIGQGFVLEGTVTDEIFLNEVRVVMANVNGSFQVLDFTFKNISDNTVNLSSFGYIQMDSTWTEGTYSIYITAWDRFSGVDHISYFEVKR